MAANPVDQIASLERSNIMTPSDNAQIEKNYM